MKTFIIILSLFFSYGTIHAQNFTLYGDKTFGGNMDEGSVTIKKFSANKLILIGSSWTIGANGDKSDPNCNNNTAPNNSDVWAVMFDTNLNIIWDKRYGGEGSERGVSSSVIVNGEIFFSAASNSDSSCEKTQNNWNYPMFLQDYWICKIDSNGNKLWDKTIGAIGNDDYPYLIKLSDDNFLVTGVSGSGISGNKTVANWGSADYWSVKFDANGNKIWDNVYGGSGQELAVGGNNNGFSVIATENGSFIIAGKTNSQMSGNVTGIGFGGHDVWIIKVDSAGNQIWDARYGGSLSNDYFGQIVQTYDGFIIVGSTASPQGGSVSDPPIGLQDVWVIQIDSLGNKQWDKRYGGTGLDVGVSIAIAPDGGYWVSADTESPQGFDITEPPYGIRDYWIFKIDSIGNKIWDKRFGGPGVNEVSNFIIMPDSSIFLAGHAEVGENSVKTDAGKGMSDYWVVHFKYPDYSVGINEYEDENFLNVFPNPVENVLSISNSKFEIKEVTLIDLQGRIIKQSDINNKTGEIDVSDIHNGLYLLKINYTNNTNSITKINIIH